MLNSIVLMGRLVADPELRSTTSGIAVCSFRIAVDRDFSGRNGAEKQTDFIDIVAWRQTAEFVSRYFSKGKMIVVQGSLQSRKWQDKEGNNRVSWEVQAASVWFGESRQSGGGYSADDDPNRFDSYTPPPATSYGHGDVSPQSAPSQGAEDPSGSYSSGSDNDFTPLAEEDLPF